MLHAWIGCNPLACAAATSWSSSEPGFRKNSSGALAAIWSSMVIPILGGTYIEMRSIFPGMSATEAYAFMPSTSVADGLTG